MTIFLLELRINLDLAVAYA